MNYTDFPGGAVIEGGAPPGSAGLFGTSGSSSGGPCLLEPQMGTLLPRNWLRPRFRWQPAAGENVFELRLHVPNQINDYVVYTAASSFTMPADIWLALADHSADQPISVTVRGAAWTGVGLAGPPQLGTAGTITIAPVPAPGAIVYWTTTGGSALRGFAVAAESVRDVLRPGQAGAQCVGCHSSTPDGLFVGFSASSQPGDGTPSAIGIRSVDGNAGQLGFLSGPARSLLARSPQQAPAFSAAHWRTGDRMMIAMLPMAARTEIAWTDLEAASPAQGTGWGILARSDGRSAASATFDHSGTRVLYTSGTSVGSGVTCTDGDVWIVPWNNRQGGGGMAVAGASTPEYNEYYPSFSSDDRFIAFNRVPSGQSSYNNAQAEVWVVPTTGGQPLRLAANDPPACAGVTSPGLTNSWPKWAPGVAGAFGRTYYWLTFSSRRGTGQNPQLYVTAVVTDEQGVHSYPALYLWNQPAGENNHTPAWDMFQIQ
jgi:hypothetical protein